MLALENYDAANIALIDSETNPFWSLTDQTYVGFAYDRAQGFLVYSVGLSAETPTNDTGFHLYDGTDVINPGDPFDGEYYKNYHIARKSVSTGAVTFYDCYAGGTIVPNGIGPSDGTYRMVVNGDAQGLNVPKLVDPRTGNVWDHHNGASGPLGCSVYLFRQEDSFKQIILPLAGPMGAAPFMTPVGISDDWVYVVEYQPSSFNTLVLTPRTIQSEETAAAQLLDYATFTYPLDMGTYWSRQCMASTQNMYVFGAEKSGTRNYRLFKFEEPTSAPYGGPTIGGGFTDISPWSSGTGPNSDSADYTHDGSYIYTGRSNKNLLYYLPDTDQLVCISKLFPQDHEPQNHDPALLKFDCTMVDLGGGTFNFYEAFVTGYMTSSWTTSETGLADGYVVWDCREVDADLNENTFLFEGVAYQDRWLFFSVEKGATWTGNTANEHIVIVKYRFSYGAAPQVLQVIDEDGWDAAYTAYATAIGNANVVAQSLTPNLADEIDTYDNGIWIPDQEAWYWSGQGDIYDIQTSPMFKLDAAFEPRASLTNAVSAPFLKLVYSPTLRYRVLGDEQRTRTNVITVAGSPPSALDPGAFYTGTRFVAVGGAGAPFLYSDMGTAPPGMFVNPTTGVFAGTPTSIGAYAVTIYATDKAGNVGSTSFTLTIGTPVAPVNTVAPQITGSPIVGATLSCSLGTWLNAPTGYIRQWYRSDVPITGANAATYVLTEDDLGANIKCVVTASNGEGSTPASSNTVGPVTETSAPVNTSPPVVSGSVVQGSPLTTTNGVWANSPTGFSYQWRNSGVNIPGATASTYDTAIGDIGDLIDCVVTASNAGGSASQASNSVGPIISGSPYAVFSPKLADVTLYRTMVVDPGDEAIDLQSEVALPYSPAVDTWTIGGASAANWEELTPGFLTVKSAARNSVKGTTQHLTVQGSNAEGDSDLIDLSVVVFADADSRFVDFVGGSDGANGLTPATAWKRLPRTPGTSNTTTLTSKGAFFKGGVRYKGQLTASNGTSQTSHAGAPGAPMVFWGTGWGGTAILDGADDVSGWAPVTSGEVFNNPNWANIEKITLGTALESYQQLFCGETMCYPAQYPTPTDLAKFEGLLLGAQGDSSQGCAQGLYTTSGAVTTKPRLYRPSAGTVCYIVDDALNAQFNNTSVAYNANGIGRWVLLWCPGNNATIVPVQQFDAVTNTLTCDAGTTAINSTGGYTAYGLIMSPYSIDKAGQYALSADGLTLYAWRPNTDQASVSQRALMTSIGSGSDNIVYGGMRVERYSGGSNRSGSYTYGGITAFNFFSGTSSANVLSNITVRQMRADGGEGCGYYGISSGGLTNSTLERFSFSECPRSSAFRCGNIFSNGSIQYNYVMDEGIGRTFLALTKSDSLTIQGNMGVNLSSTHGNFFSPYTDTVGTYTTNLTFVNNLCDNVERAFTVSVGITPTNRNNTITRNVFLARGDSATVNLYSGDKGSTYSQNIIMGATGYTYPFAAYIDDGGDSTGGVTFTDNVVAAFGWDATHLATSSWTITDNLMTVNTLPPSGTNRIVSGNTVATGAPIVVWDKTITSQMAATLGPGTIGIFWNV